MLSFRFGDAQDAYRERLRAFIREALLPAGAAFEAQDEFPWDAYRAMARFGILGLGLPCEYGGSGEEDFIALGIAAEELGRVDIGLASASTRVGVMGGLIARSATAAARQRYLPGFISGEHVISLGLTEPEAGSDGAALTMEARAVDGGWRLTGVKNSVSHLADCVATIVFARTPGTSRAEGVSAFIVDMDQPGVSMSMYEDMGLREFNRGSLQLDDVFVPHVNLLGAEGLGFGLVMGSFDFARASVALFCLGAAAASLDEAVEHLRTRKTFGKTLATRQALTMPVAEHLTRIEACRWMCYRTLWLRQTGQPHTVEAAMSKWWGVDIARDAIETALMIHGHRGWSKELPLERRFRDVTGFKLGDGAPEIHKLLIARDRIGRDVMA